MSERLTDERVREVIALADAATPGPWYSDDADAPPGDVSLWFGGEGAWKGDIVVNLGGTIVEVGHACPNEVANARFIAMAREVLPALAREVLAARAGDREEREGMADALDAAWVDGYTTGADPAWCEKQLRRMGRRNEEPHTRRAAQRLLADHAAHRAAPGGETRKEANDG